MHRLLALTGAAVLPALATAQALILPDNAALTQPSSSTGGWRSSTTGFRTQWIYDTSHFTNQGVTGPILLTRMRFRVANASTSAGGQYAGSGTTTGVNILIGTSKADFATPSTTFGFNQLTLQQVMTNGTVTVAAGAGTTPGNYAIDIAIPGGFVYDPMQGDDLLVEVDGPAFTGTLPTFATGVSLLASRCTRVSNTPQSAATGTITAGFGNVILFNFAGNGGLPTDGNGNPILAQATATSYGTGCGPSGTRSFGELFPAGAGTSLDLGTGIRMVPNVPGAPTTYTVLSGAAGLAAHTGTPLLSNAATPAALGDDTMSQACVLPFAFPFVGGSTTVLHANTNGYVVLGPTAVAGGDFSPTLGDMVGTTAGTHAGLPRLFPVWYDFVASRNTTVNPAAGLYFDVDTVNQKARLTWDDFGDISVTTAGAQHFTFQVELSADGSVEYRYGTMSTFASTAQSKIVGFTPGIPSPPPTSVDLSATMPFTTSAADLAPLALSAVPPRIGQTSAFTTNFVPPSPGVVLHYISSVQVNPGIDLGFLGITGCRAYMDPNAALQQTLAFGSGTVVVNVAVPLDINLVGLDAWSQSAALAPSFNTFGAILSNGVAVRVGTVL